MRVKIVNPNTTTSMTEVIARAARTTAAPGTEIIASTSPTGPVSIEGHYDEAISVIGVLQEVRAGEMEGIDGYVVACFGDPGLLAAREVARGPVVGIAEASMHVASLIATNFSIVTTLPRTRTIIEHLVRNYGMEHRCRRVRTIDLPVLEIEQPRSNAKGLLRAECLRAIEEDDVGALVLGCAGMADFARDLTQEFGIPVIDGVSAAVKLVEGIVGLGIGTSKKGDLAYPLPKQYKGHLEMMAPDFPEAAQ